MAATNRLIHTDVRIASGAERDKWGGNGTDEHVPLGQPLLLETSFQFPVRRA
jgi:hypothetical protein